jgi:putative redox protein
MSEPEKSPIVVTHHGGVRFDAQIRSHRISVDQPFHTGGEDAGPMPIELLGAALGTCIALYVQQYLHVRGLPYEGMRVEVDQQSVRSPSRISTFSVHVILPAAIPPQHLEILERVARSCPAHNTFADSPRMDITIDLPASVPR